jgi:hypothetical protein
MMDVYSYVAAANPAQASNIINSFGYQVTNKRDMGANLRTLVMNEGEPALRAVLAAHPDKDILLEINEPMKGSKSKLHCDCKSCRKMRDNYLNASGREENQSEASRSASQTNTFLLAAAMILAVAIISKK